MALLERMNQATKKTTSKKTTSQQKKTSSRVKKKTEQAKKKYRENGKSNGANSKYFDTGNYYKNKANTNQFFINQDKKKGIGYNDKVKGSDGKEYDSTQKKLDMGYNSDESSYMKNYYKRKAQEQKKKDYKSGKNDNDFVKGLKNVGKTAWNVFDAVTGVGSRAFNNNTKAMVNWKKENNDTGALQWKDIFYKNEIDSKNEKEAFEKMRKTKSVKEREKIIKGLLRDELTSTDKYKEEFKLKDLFTGDTSIDTLSKYTDDYIERNKNKLTDKEKKKLKTKSTLQGFGLDLGSDILTAKAGYDPNLIDILRGSGKATTIGSKGDDLAKLSKLGVKANADDVANSVSKAVNKISKSDDAFRFTPQADEIAKLTEKTNNAINNARKIRSENFLTKVGDKTVAPVINRGVYELSKKLQTKGYKALGNSIDDVANNMLGEMITNGRITNNGFKGVSKVAEKLAKQDFNEEEIGAIRAILKGDITLDDLKLAKNASLTNINYKHIRDGLIQQADESVQSVVKKIDKRKKANLVTFADEALDTSNGLRRSFDDMLKPTQSDWDDMFAGLDTNFDRVDDVVDALKKPIKDSMEIQLGEDVTYYKHMAENASMSVPKNLGNGRIINNPKAYYTEKYNEAVKALDDYKKSIKPMKFTDTKITDNAIKQFENDNYIIQKSGKVISKETGEVFNSLDDYTTSLDMDIKIQNGEIPRMTLDDYKKWNEVPDPIERAGIENHSLETRVKDMLVNNDVNTESIDDLTQVIDDLDKYVSDLGRTINGDVRKVRKGSIKVIEQFSSYMDDLLDMELKTGVISKSAKSKMKDDILTALIRQEDVSENVKKIRKRFITDKYGFGQKGHAYKGYVSKEQIDDCLQSLFADPKKVGEELSNMFINRYTVGEKAIYDSKATKHLTELLGYKDITKAPKGYQGVINIADVKNNVHNLARDQVVAKFGEDLQRLSRDELNEVFNDAYRQIAKKTYGLDYDMDLNELATPFIDISKKNYEVLKNTMSSDIRYLDPNTISKFNIVRKLQITKQQNKLLSLYDDFTTAYKTVNTAYNPGWQVKNFFDNYMQSYIETGIEALSPKRHEQSTRIVNQIMGDRSISGIKIPSRSLSDDMLKQTYGKTKYTYQDIMDALEDSGFVESSLFASELGNKAYNNMLGIVKSSDLSIGDKTKAIINNYLLPQSEKSIWSLGGNHNAVRSEAIARTNIVLAEIDKGVSLEKAIDKSKKALFDYNDLSEFEQQVMKRIIPFYTWSRKNIPYQIENLLLQPMKYNYFNDTKNALNQAGIALSGGENDDRNKYTEDMVRLPWNHTEVTGGGLNKGGYEWETRQNYGAFMNLATPFDEFTKFPLVSKWDAKGDESFYVNEGEEYLNKLNPLLKLVYDLKTNEDFFDKQIIGDDSEYGDTKGEQLLNYLNEQVSPIQIENGKPMPQSLAQFVRKYKDAKDFKKNGELFKYLTGYKNNYYSVGNEFNSYGQIPGWWDLTEEEQELLRSKYKK